MALLFMDGFAAGDAATKWTFMQYFSISSVSPRVPGGYYASGLSVSTVPTFGRTITPSAQVIIGMGFYDGGASGASASTRIVISGDAAATTHLSILRNTTTGFIELRRGTTSGTLLATGTTFIPLETWHYLEVRATIADAGGICQVRLDGASTNEIDFTGDTKNAGTSTNIDYVLFAAGASTVVAGRVADTYICDATGSSNNTFLGDVVVRTLVPNGAGNYTQLTPTGSATNYQNVDEIPFSTTDYNGSATVGQKDTYTLTDLPVGTTQVFGVQNNMIAAKSDATAASARTALRTNATDYFGTTRVLGTSYQNYNDLYNTNPNTTVAWTVADVNALEAGMEVA